MAKPVAGPVKLFGGCGERTTELIEDICFEKIRGCSCTEGAACFLIDAGLHRDAHLLAEMGDALQSDRVLRNCFPPNAIDFET